MSLAKQLQRQHLADLEPYASARRSMSGGSVWLNANESPFSNDYQLDTSQLNRYPAFQSAQLNDSYARYAGVSPSQVLSCRGSDEAIDLLIRAFCEPKDDEVIICPPTYGMYAISARTQGAAVREIPLLQDTWQLDLDQLLPAVSSSKLVFLCSPSNPLGNCLHAGDLEQVLERARQTLVVVDEAYIEFCPQASVTRWLERFPNLVVLRTLSKAFALAGARCGFALADAEVIAVLRKVLAPYPLPDLTLQVASQAVSDDGLQRLQQQVSDLLQQRDKVTQGLKRLGLSPVAESATNFILIRLQNAEQLMAAAAEQGILLRNQSAQKGLHNCVRISIGSAEENQQLLTFLNHFFSHSAIGETL